MKKFKNKFWFKLIALICLFLTVLNFGIVSKVQAQTDSEEDEIWGGELLSPIVRLVTGIGDGIMDILHEAILSQDLALVKIDGATAWDRFIQIFLAIIAAVAVIAIAATGLGALVTAGIMAITAKAILAIGITALATGVIVAEHIEADYIPNDIYLPTYKFTPLEIFSNEIHLFDVNFFNPMSDKEQAVKGESSHTGQTTITTTETVRKISKVTGSLYKTENFNKKAWMTWDLHEKQFRHFYNAFEALKNMTTVPDGFFSSSDYYELYGDDYILGYEYLYQKIEDYYNAPKNKEIGGLGYGGDVSYSQAYGKKPSIAYRDKTTYTLEVFLTAEDGKKIDKCYVDFQVEWTEEIITKTETIER